MARATRVVPAFFWMAAQWRAPRATRVVPAFFWMAAQWRQGSLAPGITCARDHLRQGSLASERIAPEGDDQNGRIVAKLVAIGHTRATLRALEPQIFRR